MTFYDGLLLGHYWRQEQAPGSHENDPGYEGDDFDDDLADEDLDMMDDWD